MSKKKVVIYNIVEQKLLTDKKIKENKELIAQNTAKLKTSLIQSDLLKILQNKYNIEKFYKGL
jgi:hypothetical protein